MRETQDHLRHLTAYSQVPSLVLGTGNYRRTKFPKGLPNQPPVMSPKGSIRYRLAATNPWVG